MIDAVVELSWRAYPAALIALVGLVMAARGTRMMWGWAAYNDSRHNLRFIRGFRITVIGLAIAAIAVAWVWQLLWVLILALAIGGEETLESSVHAYAVRRGLRLEEEARARAANVEGGRRSCFKPRGSLGSSASTIAPADRAQCSPLGRRRWREG